MDFDEKFMRCMRIVFENEGGYVNNPDDGGGKTNMGITAKTLLEANRRGITNITDVRNLTRSVCEDIYKAMYWDVSKCDLLIWPLDLVVFDTLVIAGNVQSIKFLQRVLNMVLDRNELVVDGVFGKKSINALGKCVQNEKHAVLASDLFLDMREDFHKQICIKKPQNKIFLKGWMNRVNKLRDIVKKC